MRHVLRVTLRPPTPAEEALLVSRGVAVPTAMMPLDRAAFWPIYPRWRHRLHAHRHGYFWLPCPRCGRDFGGHEIGQSIPDPARGPGAGQMTCAVCSSQWRAS